MPTSLKKNLSRPLIVIDSHRQSSDRGAPSLCKLLRTLPYPHFVVYRAPEKDLPDPWSPTGPIILSGSQTSIFSQEAWVLKLLEWIQIGLKKGKPFLGICFGHQLLARAIAALHSPEKPSSLSRLFERYPKKHLGWISLKMSFQEKTQQGLSPLPKQLQVFVSHQEGVKREGFDLLPGLTVLATSDYCPLQAFQWNRQPVFGFQFHPERTLSEGQILLRNAKQLKLDYEIHDSGPLSINSKGVDDENTGKQLFTHFLNLAKEAS